MSERLTEALRQLRGQAHGPSYRAIAARTRGAISHTQVKAILDGTVHKPSWQKVEAIVRALGGDRESLERFYQMWLEACSSTRVNVMPVEDADLAGGMGPEYRVASGLDGSRRYCVAQLTDNGLVTIIPDLEQWQAYAIVAILHHPFSI